MNRAVCLASRYCRKRTSLSSITQHLRNPDHQSPRLPPVASGAHLRSLDLACKHSSSQDSTRLLHVERHAALRLHIPLGLQQPNRSFGSTGSEGGFDGGVGNEVAGESEAVLVIADILHANLGEGVLAGSGMDVVDSSRSISGSSSGSSATMESLRLLYRFFHAVGISEPTSVAKTILAHPALLRSEPSDLAPKIRLLLDYGASLPDIAAVRLDAAWLTASTTHINAVLELLVEFGVSKDKLGSMVLRGPRILTVGIDTLRTNLHLLQQQGVQVADILQNCPSLASSPALPRKLAVIRSKLGDDVAANILRTFPLALVQSESVLEAKITSLEGMFGRERAVPMVANCPRLLGADMVTIEENYHNLGLLLDGKVPPRLRNTGHGCSGKDPSSKDPSDKDSSGKDVRGKDVESKSSDCVDSSELAVDRLVTARPQVLCRDWQADIGPKLAYLQQCFGLPAHKFVTYR